VIEVTERVTLEAWSESKTPIALNNVEDDPALVRGITGELIRILEPLGTFYNGPKVSSSALTDKFRPRIRKGISARNI
jgi:hypothetical protein